MKKSTLSVIAVFLALLAGTLVVMLRKPERGMSRLAISVDKEQIDKLTIKGKNAVELKKEGGAWLLANGKAADAGAVNRLLDALGRIKSSDLLTSDKGRYGEFEVDAEKGCEVVAFAGKKLAAQLTVGKNVSGGLALLAEGGIYKVTALSQSVFSKPASSWIERKLFTDKLDDATRLEVALAGAAPYALVKKDGAWGLEDPKALPAGFRFDADAARSLVSAVASLRAKDFEESDPGADKTGLAPSGDVIKVVFAPAPPAASAEPAKAEPAPVAASEPATRTLFLGKAKEGDSKDIYAKIDGRNDLFTLSDSTVKSLRKSPTDLRDLKLMSFDKAKVQKLSVVDGKNSLSFEKKEGAWQLVKSSDSKPADFELDPNAVERRVAALATARGLKVLDAKATADTGLAAPAAKVTATLEGGASFTLAFGKETKDEEREASYAKGNADGATYLVAKWTRSNLTGGLASFKKQAEQGGGFENLDPKALSGLPPDVRDSLMRQMREKQQQQELIKRLQQQAEKTPPAAPAKP
jgi:hypothetical protein